MRPARPLFLVSAALAALVLLGWLAALGPGQPPDAATVRPAGGTPHQPPGQPAGLPSTHAAAKSGRDPARFGHELEAWVAHTPEAACAWVLSLPASDRLDAATALLIAAADQPELASELARHLCKADPAFIREHGTILLAVLVEAGAPEVALRFAATGGAESLDWLDSTFSLLAEQDPEKAALTALARPEAEGFSTVARIWAGQDPARLAGFAMERLEGISRALALEEALPQWLARDPVAVSGWLDRFEPAAELDAGVSALALLPALARPHPDVALGWAASIVDPELRARTLASVATQWAEVNPFAARQHVSIAGELTLADRLNLLAVLDRPPRPPD